MLGRMLTADPAKRITIPEIMQHPWFTTRLPPRMGQLNYNLVQTLVPAGLQSVEEIEQIVQQATRAESWSGGVIITLRLRRRCHE